jgi:hypothetical protein
VFLFATPPANSTTGLLRRLTAFQRVHLAPGASATVKFAVSVETVKLTQAATGDIVSFPGVWTVDVATGPLPKDVAVSKAVRVTGAEAVVLERFPRY